jgi:hypothetical protein
MKMMTYDNAYKPLSEEDRILFKMFLAKDRSTVTLSVRHPLHLGQPNRRLRQADQQLEKNRRHLQDH